MSAIANLLSVFYQSTFNSKISPTQRQLSRGGDQRPFFARGVPFPNFHFLN
nr:MAG TPA: hypothetical protein [Caudoviricetes sp.]